MTKDLPFYKKHWLIDSGASNHIMPYLEDFSSLLQGERLASKASASKPKIKAIIMVLLS